MNLEVVGSVAVGVGMLVIVVAQLGGAPILDRIWDGIVDGVHVALDSVSGDSARSRAWRRGWQLAGTGLVKALAAATLGCLLGTKHMLLWPLKLPQRLVRGGGR